MEITMEIAVGVIIVVAVGGLAFLTRANWNAHMGQNLGKEYMKEFGIDGTIAFFLNLQLLHTVF